LIELLKPKLNLKPGETDLIAMQHRFIYEINGKRYSRTSSLIEIGDKNGFSAMSKTVATPTAIGAELVLEGVIKARGVIRPVTRDIYDPVLERLDKAGIRLIEEEEEL
jgi:saccharopine dehydrogenase-like NADP-dependent oxidoreductase